MPANLLPRALVGDILHLLPGDHCVAGPAAFLLACRIERDTLGVHA